MGNQFLRDSVLFVTPVGERTTELSIRGNKLALYTEDNAVYRRFRDWKQLIFKVDYTRESRHNNAIVAADLFFPLSAQQQLLKALRPTVVKERVSVRH